MRKMLPEKDQSAEEKAKGQHTKEQEHNEAHHTHIPNAHAAGVGAMGRNDEKLPTSSTDEAEDRTEPAY